MLSRTFTAALAFAIVAFPAAPQEPKLVESIEVRVASIDVVVRDKAGKPVTGLTKDDFQLFEDGVVQPITNFYEMRRDGVAPERAAEAPAEAAQPTAVANGTTEWQMRNQFRAWRHFMTSTMQAA